MPRLTYIPSPSSAAARSAICSLDQLIGRSRSPGDRPLLYGLDGGLLGGEGDDALDEDAGQVDLVGIEGVDQLLDLGDRHARGPRAQRVEVARGAVEVEVAVPVTADGSHQRDVGGDALLQDEL